MTEEALNAYLAIVERSVSFEFNSPEYGKLARKIIEMLYSRREQLSDDRVAILMNISTAEARRILQFLSKNNMIGVVKSTTPDYRTEYSWYVDDTVIKQALKKRIELVSSKLSMLIRGLTEGAYYVCPNCHRRYSLDEELAYNGQCPICKVQLIYVNNINEINKITEIIEKLEKYENNI
ncbi:transcription factor [Thermoproteus tenax]|uniref:Transcription factor E n=1 Tax=Thermoproteus tenax (strain ATCC 35583 / DSM 2078 / JCM 9277 / NBRC 100435 / Kra 1) TaxID=768679 RepID=G4RLV5_THETK|nr:transcription factor [Thermoproteus tenax]CCC82550.1 Transcription initiation factor E [Thermoproteus tenax Kra 1]